MNNTNAPSFRVPFSLPTRSDVFTSLQDTLLDCIMDTDIEMQPQEPLQVAKEHNTIKHIVCSGGGTFGFIAYGILKQSCIDGFWDIRNIESMYGTSIGAILCTLLSLLRNDSGALTWNLLDTYIVMRPWQNVFKMDLYTITNSIQNGGILNISSVIDIFAPLFKTLDIDIDITLEKYYERFGIEMHFYSTELESMEPVDMSYKTHPTMGLLDAVYSSCSLPILFSPYAKDGKTYFDGGLFCNYPLLFCMQNTENHDEIMGLRYIGQVQAAVQAQAAVQTQAAVQAQAKAVADAERQASGAETQAKEEAAVQTVAHADAAAQSATSVEASVYTKGTNEEEPPLLNYIFTIFKNLTTKIRDYETNASIKHQLDIPSPELSIYDIYLAIIHSEKRKQMIDNGVAYWRANKFCKGT